MGQGRGRRAVECGSDVEGDREREREGGVGPIKNSFHKQYKS